MSGSESPIDAPQQLNHMDQFSFYNSLNNDPLQNIQFDRGADNDHIDQSQASTQASQSDQVFQNDTKRVSLPAGLEKTDTELRVFQQRHRSEDIFSDSESRYNIF